MTAFDNMAQSPIELVSCFIPLLFRDNNVKP